MKTVNLDVASLRRHPDNARDKRECTKKEVSELAASIKEHGLLQPLVVTPDGDGHLILAGHRRHAALASLGLKQASCVVLDGDEQDSLAILLGENASHKAVDPLRESSAVAKLVEGFAEETHPFDRAAAVLGKSVAWVRGRMRLTALSEAWRKAYADSASPIREWPVGHLELVAALPEHVQDEVLEEWTAFVETGVPLLADLKASLARSTCDLSKVPWDRDAAGLVEGAPACSACPFRASAQGVLFADDSKGGDRCLNAPCFEAKRRATAAAAIVSAREKHGEALRVETTFALEDVPVPDGVTVHREFELVPRAKAKGGFPVLRLRTLEVVFMAAARAPGPKETERGTARRPRPVSLADKRKELEKRRRIRALEVLRGCLLGRTVAVGTKKRPVEISPPAPAVPALLDLVALALVYGTGVPVGEDDGPAHPLGGSDLVGTLAAVRRTSESALAETRARLWSRVRAPIAKALDVRGPMSPDAVARLAEQSEAICAACGLDWKAGFASPASDAIPEPKAWRTRKAS
jgi:ParB/RepB/Spo0J family partition protein